MSLCLLFKPSSKAEAKKDPSETCKGVALALYTEEHAAFNLSPHRKNKRGIYELKGRASFENVSGKEDGGNF